MKKFYSLIVLSLLILQAHAQSYFPMLDSVSNVWYYTGNIIPVRQEATAASICDYNSGFGFESNSLFTTGDTVMNSITYKKLTQTAFNWPGFDCTYGYLREDTATRKIYFVDNVFSPEILIYDFAMIPGDSIYLSFNQSFGYYSTGYYQLDSIGTVQIKAGTRRLFYLNNHTAPSQFPMQWIESVGHPGHLVYTYSQNYWGMLFSMFCTDKITRDYYQMLTCFEHNSQKVYFDSCSQAFAVQGGCIYYADSCNYWNICGSLNENNNILNAQLSPNPFENFADLLIEASTFTSSEIKIYNLAGQLMQPAKTVTINSGKNRIPLDLKALNAGYYLVGIQSNNIMLYLKIIKTTP
jgi:hypothetical protein